MTKPYSFLITFLIFFHCSVQEESPGNECGSLPGKNERTITVSLNSKKNETGEWMDTLIARTETRNSSNLLNLDITHRVTDCDGKRIVYIKGVTKDASVEINEDKIKFHPRSGKNIAISNNGFTVQRINIDDAVHSAVFTNRPLKNDEMFAVRVDKKIAKHSHGIGIGIMKDSPDVVEILPQMYSSPNAWMFHGPSIWSNGKEYLSYKAINIDFLKVGDTIGVMRNSYGAIHFFVNGVDQGPAMSNVPNTVYGVVQLRHNDVKATIVNAKTSSLS